MNCRRFQKLLLEYLEDSLSPAKRAAAEEHFANCSSCRQIAQQYREVGRSLSDGFSRETATVALSLEQQRQLVAMLQERSIDAATEPAASEWWSRLAWIGASAVALLIGLLMITGFPFRSASRGPDQRVSGGSISDSPIVMRFSYCEPNYTFRREADLVIDSITCNPRVIEQTLRLAHNQKPVNAPTKSPL